MVVFSIATATTLFSLVCGEKNVGTERRQIQGTAYDVWKGTHGGTTYRKLRDNATEVPFSSEVLGILQLHSSELPGESEDSHDLDAHSTFIATIEEVEEDESDLDSSFQSETVSRSAESLRERNLKSKRARSRAQQGTPKPKESEKPDPANPVANAVQHAAEVQPPPPQGVPGYPQPPPIMPPGLQPQYPGEYGYGGGYDEQPYGYPMTDPYGYQDPSEYQEPDNRYRGYGDDRYAAEPDYAYANPDPYSQYNAPPPANAHANAPNGYDPVGYIRRPAQTQSHGSHSAVDMSMFERGDIPYRWREIVAPTPLNAFNGRWQVILPRSDSMDDILSALNIGNVKKRLMSSHVGTTDVSIENGGQSVFMQNYLPANTKVAALIPLNGHPFPYTERETGTWTTRALFGEGRIGQIRTSPRGTMYDVRAVFARDPEGIYTGPGPLMLFRWSFVPVGSNSIYTVNRWLRGI